MKISKIFLFLTVSIVALSCSNGGDDPVPVYVNPYSITQDVETIMEGEPVTFTLNGPDVTDNSFCSWKFENNGTFDYSEVYNRTITFSLTSPGTTKVICKLRRADDSYETVEKIVNVQPRPFYTVKIKKIEILNGYNDEWQNNNGYHVKFRVVFFQPPLPDRITEENLTSFNGEQTIFPKVWDLGSDNYTARVYKTGNLYPYSKALYLYPQSTDLVNGEFTGWSDYDKVPLMFNQYRESKPTTIMAGIFASVRLTLEWSE